MKSPPLRAAMLGLGAALMLGAFGMLFAAFRGATLECTELPFEECTLLQDSAAEMARTQTLAALGMALGAVGLFLFLRNPATPPTPTSR